MPRRSHDNFGTSPTPRAPRIAPCPLPDIRSPLMKHPIPITMSPPLATPRPPTTRHRRSSTYGSTNEPGYSSSLETSTPLRPRPTSQVVRTPLAPAPPLRGILKTGGGANPKTNELLTASLIQQDRDGYASSPEKGTTLKPSQASHSRQSKGKPPLVANPRNTNPSTPPATLHWKLLPYDARRPKGKLQFDFACEVDEIVLAGAAAAGGSRPLSVLERNKSAADPGLTEMVIHCAEIPDWPVHVARQSGIRCVDVFEAIRDTYNVVLTAMERSIHQSRVRDIERRRPPTPEGTKKGVRRRDLLDGKTLFLGLDWRPSDARYPNGCWCLKVGSPPT